MSADSASKLNPALKLIIALGCSAALLSGCGIRGSLKTPPPVFGQKTIDKDKTADQSSDADEDEDFGEDLLDPERDTSADSLGE